MGLLDLLFVAAVILIVLWLLGFVFFKPRHHHMGTASHRHHHNSYPTGIRTQTITLTKQQPKIPQAAPEMLPNFLKASTSVKF